MAPSLPATFPSHSTAATTTTSTPSSTPTATPNIPSAFLTTRQLQRYYNKFGHNSISSSSSTSSLSFSTMGLIGNKDVKVDDTNDLSHTGNLQKRTSKCLPSFTSLRLHSTNSNSSNNLNNELAFTSSNSSLQSSKSFSTSTSTSSSSANSNLSSTRGTNAVTLLPTYLSDARSVTQYHPIDAPEGALQLSVAENQMLEDLLVPAIRTFSKDDGVNKEEGEEEANNNNNSLGLFYSDQIYYQPTQGRPGLRNAMSGYLQRILNLPQSSSLDQDGLILGAGCNAVLENLCFCLAEQGEGVLLPTPYYAAFEFDLVARAGLKILPVNTMEFHPQSKESSEAAASDLTPIPPSSYYPTRESLDAAYNKAKEAGINPKILLLSHPNNPLGICYPPSIMEECIAWAREKQVHLISDEIYAGSVYRKKNENGEDTFQSALALAAGHEEENNDTDGKGLGLGPYIHLVYALSKDFALSGLRVGAAYSENQEIRLPMQKLNDLCQISSQTQLLVEKMLSAEGSEDDTLWCTDEFLPMNHDRIRSRCDDLQQCLDEVNIPYLQADSGLFVWMDFRRFLPPLEPQNLTPSGQETSDSMDARERSLYLELMQEYGLLFTPGRSMRTEYPGFFRCVFTAASDDEFRIGLDRIRAFVKAKDGASK